MQTILKESPLAGFPSMNDLMQHLMPPSARFLRVFLHRVTDDTRTHLDHGIVRVTGGVVRGVRGEGVVFLMLGPVFGFGFEGFDAGVVHVDDQVGVALDDVVVEGGGGVDFGFFVLFEGVV